MKALGKIIHYQSINSEKIREVAADLNDVIREKILARIDLFCGMVKKAALEMGVDISYKSHDTDEIPNTYVSRLVPPALTPEKVREILEDLKNSNALDRNSGLELSEYVKSRTGKPEISHYNANNAAIKISRLNSAEKMHSQL